MQREIEAASIEADRQESALLQQIVLFDIMSLTDPGREPCDSYQTLSRLQDEVRYSDEIYRLLYKKGSLFQGEGLQDLRKDTRRLVQSLVRQVLDLIEDHHAKIRSKAPRFSFNVDPGAYKDMFYFKPASQDEDQAALELFPRTSEAEDEEEEDSDQEGSETIEEPSPRRGSMREPRGSMMRRQSRASPSQRSPESPGKQTAPPGTPMPKLFPAQKTYQLKRSATQGWHVVAPGASGETTPVRLTPPVLRKRTHFFENPNVLGSRETGRTITDVADDDDLDEESLESGTSTGVRLRKRIQEMNPIFLSHFGPETRPPGSHIRYDLVSTKPVPAVPPEPQPVGFPQPFTRPNVLAYVKGTIPRVKSVRPLRPSELAALAFAQQRRSMSPRTRPSTAEASSAAAASTSGASTSRSKSPTRRAVQEEEGETAAPVLSGEPPQVSKSRTVTFNEPSSSSSGSSSGLMVKDQGASTSLSPRQSLVKLKDEGENVVATTRQSLMMKLNNEGANLSPRQSVIKFNDEGANAISLTGPGRGARASFINLDPDLMAKGPNYGRIRDFPVLVPSMLNAGLGLSFPENTEIFTSIEEGAEEDQEDT